VGTYRRGYIGTVRLGLVALCAVLLVLYLESAKGTVKDPLLGRKLAAAELMRSGLSAVRQERLRLGLTIDPALDPNGTGIIGSDYTDLTTTLGSLSSKRTSTNPNFAGAIVDMLSEAGVKPGGSVAISFSGSFPALNIAVLAAVHALELKPAIISSIGASMYGANDPELTWLDMERILRQRGVLPYASSAAALGGIVETEGGLDHTGINAGLRAMERCSIPYLEEHGEQSVERDIDTRLGIYDRIVGGRRPDAFINVGGSLASLGMCPEAAMLPTGLVRHIQSCSGPKRGIIFRMAEREVPIIHLLNIKRIARRYGLPSDPVPLPAVPDGRVMKAHSYPVLLSVSAIVLLCALMMILKHYPVPARAPDTRPQDTSKR
jgi:poly-gamma-glutamate system protein